MLSENSITKIERELAKYPSNQRRSTIISALRIAQEEHGYLAQETIAEVARYIGIEPIAAYEVASFYNMFDLKPLGRYKLTVCGGLSCALRGGVNTAQYLQEKLGISWGETSADGKFTLVEGECMGACGDAPVMLLNNHKMCSFMTAEAIDKKLAELE